MDLSLSTREEGERTVVVVEGEIDVFTSPKLREQLLDLVSHGHYHLVLDMDGVEFLDSTGLGVLLGGLKRVRARDGTFRLACRQEQILKLFRITGLTKVFSIYSSIGAAIGRLIGLAARPVLRTPTLSAAATMTARAGFSSPYEAVAVLAASECFAGAVRSRVISHLTAPEPRLGPAGQHVRHRRRAPPTPAAQRHRLRWRHSR